MHYCQHTKKLKCSLKSCPYPCAADGVMQMACTMSGVDWGHPKGGLNNHTRWMYLRPIPRLNYHVKAAHRARA